VSLRLKLFVAEAYFLRLAFAFAFLFGAFFATFFLAFFFGAFLATFFFAFFFAAIMISPVCSDRKIVWVPKTTLHADHLINMTCPNINQINAVEKN
tara:strand:- start:1526 stop:1813 length:288 start_codon:yes stop_codon:yes gene_type:complete